MESPAMTTDPRPQANEPMQEPMQEPVPAPIEAPEPAIEGPRFALPELPVSRRTMLKMGGAAIVGIAGSSYVFDWVSRLMGPAGRAPIDPVAAAYEPAAHRWGFVVDATRCIGCGLCVVACKEENNVPRDEEHTRTWIERHVRHADGTVTIDSPEAGIRGFAAEPEQETAADATDAFFVPRLCMQCEDSPCTGVCPVGATYRTPDGVILVDAERCIGCGYCLLACPYGARYLVPAGAHTPQGVAGVADKCTFCYHRVVRGENPACVEVCPAQARLFGDLNDPDSVVSTIIRSGTTTVMRPELETLPRVHYIGLEGRSTA
jgi:tetrathionate reductase subunit B